MSELREDYVADLARIVADLTALDPALAASVRRCDAAPRQVPAAPGLFTGRRRELATLPDGTTGIAAAVQASQPPLTAAYADTRVGVVTPRRRGGKRDGRAVAGQAPSRVVLIMSAVSSSSRPACSGSSGAGMWRMLALPLWSWARVYWESSTRASLCAAPV